MFPVIDLGPFAIQAPGLILILSLFIGFWLTGRFANALKTNGDAIENSLTVGLIAGILSARIGFLLQNPSILVENPLSIFSLTPSMFNTGFGLLAGFLAAYISAQRNHLPFWPTLDTMTPLILLVFMGVHLANFASGNAYGLPTSLPWGVRLWGDIRHPVQLYALILALGVFVWLLLRTRWLSKTGYMQSCLLALTTTASLAVITIFIRAFIAEKILLWQFDLIQILALLLLVGALGLVYRKTQHDEKEKSVILSLGSNLDAESNLQKGIKDLSKQFDVLKKSSIYQTSDVREKKAAKQFLNQVVEIRTQLPYPALRERLKTIEAALGRERGNKDTVPLDLDILTYNKDVFVHNGRHIPDPGIQNYRYIAEPLAEMSPDFRHPGNGKSIQKIMDQIPDESKVNKIKEVENGTKR